MAASINQIITLGLESQICKLGHEQSIVRSTLGTPHLSCSEFVPAGQQPDGKFTTGGYRTVMHGKGGDIPHPHTEECIGPRYCHGTLSVDGWTGCDTYVYESIAEKASRLKA